MIPTPQLSNDKLIQIQIGTPEDPFWSFSFRYWKEMSYFEVNQQSSKWFKSLLEKLSDMSEMKVGDFLENGILKDRNRYHKVNWKSRNVPIKKSDLSHVPKCFLNEDDYEIVQFQLSKATGRVIGFFDNMRVFNIILLDPLHNLQPSRDFNYSVNPTSPTYTPFQLLHKKIRETLHSVQHHCETVCDPLVRLQQDIEDEYGNFHMIMVDSILFEDLSLRMEEKGCESVNDLLLEYLCNET